MNPSGRRSSLANAHALPHVSTPWAYIRRDLPESNRRTKARVPCSVSQVSDLTGGEGSWSGNGVERCRRISTLDDDCHGATGGTRSSSKEQKAGRGMGKPA